MTTKGRTTALPCTLLYIPRTRCWLHVDANKTEHPAYLYSATDVARCRDGAVSRVSLKYDAAECSSGVLNMEWYLSLCLDAAECSPRLVTPPCSWSFFTSWFTYMDLSLLTMPNPIYACAITMHTIYNYVSYKIYCLCSLVDWPTAMDSTLPS